MPTAKKLPSGSWRCQVFSHYEYVPLPDGTTKKKRIYESFTCDDPSRAGKRRAEAMAAEYADKKERRSHPEFRLTFGEALTKYIDERSDVLSPASIRKYRSMQRNCLAPLSDYKLKDVTQDIIQKLINEASGSMSPKSVRDMNGLITAVMARFAPDIRLKTSLPKKVRPNIYIPSEEDIRRLVQAVKGTNMEVPVMLAAFGAMRRGEISALRKSDISGNVIHVSKTMVYSDNCDWIVKTPKSYAGDRFVTVPRFVVDAFHALPGDGIDMTPNKITSSFEHVLKRAGVKHFRFHDLRHYNASIQHALGIPDAYIMQSGGWGNDSVLKEVYRHAIPDIQDQMNSKAINYFESMQHEMQHDN